MLPLLEHVINSPEHEAIRRLRDHQNVLTDTLSLDCASQVNHCVCSENFEYFRKPEHVLKCITKGKCFHCQRYRAMHRQHETIKASAQLIHAAAALGKLEILKFLHQSGCSLESETGVYKLRPLHIAIANGHFNIFCYLLTQKVNVNAPALSQGTSYTPLMLAVQYKQEDMARHLLLINETDVNYRNSLCQSPVFLAVQNNSQDILELLLDREYTIVDRNLPEGRLRKLHHPNAMLEAVIQDNDTLLIRLLENRTKVNFVYRGYHTSTTATTVSVVNNSYKSLKLLLEYGADYDFDDIEDLTAIGWAKRLRWKESLDAFLESIFGQCPFHEQKAEEPTEDDVCICESKLAFIENAYSLEVVDESPHPFIEIWKMSQWLDISDTIKRLSLVGYDINYQDELGRTSLHMAVETQSVPGLRTLIQLGADPNLKDACLATPFWHAVFWEKESMIKELLFANVDLECKPKEDAYRIGLPWASNDPSLEHDEIVFSENHISTLGIAIKKNFCYIVDLLFESGYDTSNEDVQRMLAQDHIKPEMRTVLQKHTSEPASLFNSCRNNIRKLCGIRIHDIVGDLDIPQKLKDCLLLRDLINLKIEPEYSDL